MGTPLDAGNELALSALVEAHIAAGCFQEVYPLLAQIYCLQGDPGAMFQAADDWMACAEAIDRACEEAESIKASLLGTGWEGTDCDAFCDKIDDYVLQLRLDMFMAVQVAVVMYASAVMIFLAIVMVMAMATIEVICAGIYLALLAGTVTAPAAAAFRAELAPLTAMMISVATTTNQGIEAITTGFAIAAGAALSANVFGQAFNGNPGIVIDLARGTVDSLATVALGLASYGINDGLKNGIHRGSTPFVYTGVGGGLFGGFGELFGEDGVANLNPVTLPSHLIPDEQTDEQVDDRTW